MNFNKLHPKCQPVPTLVNRAQLLLDLYAPCMLGAELVVAESLRASVLMCPFEDGGSLHAALQADCFMAGASKQC